MLSIWPISGRNAAQTPNTVMHIPAMANRPVSEHLLNAPDSAWESGTMNTPFLEVCSVGLVSTLFPSVDDVQHGNLMRAGDFLAALFSTPPAEIHLVMSDGQEIYNLGHVVLVSNMPYIGFHYRVGSAAAFQDGLLDVLFSADLTKLELLSYVFQGVGSGKPEDPRIQHYRVRKVEIDTLPAMLVMADGRPLGEGRMCIRVRRHALAVMVGLPVPEMAQEGALEPVKLLEQLTDDTARA